MKKQKIFIFLAITLLGLLGLATLPKVYSENQTAIDKGISYLKSQPQTAWSTMALAANGETGLDLNHLKSVPQSQKSATTYSKYILALVAVGKNPTTFGSEDYVAALKNYFDGSQFGDKGLLNDDVWAILALGSVGQENLLQVEAAKNYILSWQGLDGGWGYATSADSDPNSAAATLLALLEAGVPSASQEIQKGLSYLKPKQNSDGGFPYIPGDVSDSCSDAWVLSVVYKLGQDPNSSDWLKNGKSPLDHLLFLQDEDGGFWWQEKQDNKFCSAYAVLALLAKTYPVGTSFNQHHLRVEGVNETICETKVHGGTAMDIVIAGANACGYNYKIVEYPGMGLYLSELKGEISWMYIVNTVLPMVGADSYYLEVSDEVLWYSGDWLDNGWFITKLELSKTENQAVGQVKYYNSQTKTWENLAKEVKVQIGGEERTTDNSGRLLVNLTNFQSGVYPVFVKRQIIEETGYIRSEKVNLIVGEAPQEHQVGLQVEIEGVSVPPGGRQESISFSVSPDLLDFGKLKAGQSSVKNMNFSNGEAAIYLQTEVTGDNIFKDNLEIDNSFWPFFLAEIAANQNRVFAVKFSVPQNYSGDLGVKEGELTFWAMKK